MARHLGWQHVGYDLRTMRHVVAQRCQLFERSVFDDRLAEPAHLLKTLFDVGTHLAHRDFLRRVSTSCIELLYRLTVLVFHRDDHRLLGGGYVDLAHIDIIHRMKLDLNLAGNESSAELLVEHVYADATRTGRDLTRRAIHNHGTGRLLVRHHQRR